MAASNNSPLRGSQSVPMLRHRTFRQEMDFRRRSSGASDTLGHDVFAARRVLQTMMLDDCGFEALKTDSWEEDIDYCYEHAVEADCDYAWERPSLDFGRSDEEESFDARSSESMSSDMLASGRFDVPALSPASALSSATAGHEAFTPTAPAPSHTPFIPCPGDVMTATTKSMLHLHSTAFDMMVGEFHLSPLLLIPGDCRQHSSSSMQHSSPAVPEDGCDAAGARHFAFHFQNGCDEPGPALHADQRSSTPMHPQQRSSASTTASSAGSHVFERHASTTSAGTDFTAPNRSTTSLDIEALIPKPAAFHDHENEVQSSPPSAHARVDSKMAAMHPLLEHEATPAAAFASRSSESNLALWASADAEMPGRAPARHRRNDSVPLQVRRQRTRTASLGRPPPPVGQYALYGSPVRPAPATRV